MHRKDVPLSYLVVFIFFIGGGHAMHLTGITVRPDHPRADTYMSFFHDLTESIASVANFSYSLRMMEADDTDKTTVKYGGEIGETSPQGIVGQVYHNLADFVMADLEITPERLKFIDFTRPFQRSSLAALIRRTSPVWPKVTTRLDGDVEGANNVTLRRLLQLSKRGVIEGSYVQRYFRTSKNPRVYHLLPMSIPTYTKALEMLNTTDDFALIGDRVHLSLIAAEYCHLMVISATNRDEDIGKHFEVQYAIGLGHRSPFLGYFEGALEELETSGELAKLIRRHWRSQCPQAEAIGVDQLMKDDEQGGVTDVNSRREQFDRSWSTILVVFSLQLFWFKLLDCLG